MKRACPVTGWARDQRGNTMTQDDLKAAKDKKRNRKLAKKQAMIRKRIARLTEKSKTLKT